MRAVQVLSILVIALAALWLAGERAPEGPCVRMSALLRAAPLPLVGGLRTFTALTGEGFSLAMARATVHWRPPVTLSALTAHVTHAAARRHVAQQRLERAAAMSAAAASTGGTGVSIAFVTVPDKVFASITSSRMNPH